MKYKPGDHITILETGRLFVIDEASDGEEHARGPEYRLHCVASSVRFKWWPANWVETHMRLATDLDFALQGIER